MLDSAQRIKKEAATCRNKNQSELSNQRAKARGELQKPPARSRWRFLNWMIAPPLPHRSTISTQLARRFHTSKSPRSSDGLTPGCTVLSPITIGGPAYAFYEQGCGDARVGDGIRRQWFRCNQLWLRHP